MKVYESLYLLYVFVLYVYKCKCMQGQCHYRMGLMLPTMELGLKKKVKLQKDGLP